jgi:hypothetical protein
MITVWMDGEFVLASYLTALALLFCLLAAFACFSILASVVLLCLGRPPSAAQSSAPKHSFDRFPSQNSEVTQPSAYCNTARTDAISLPTRPLAV